MSGSPILQDGKIVVAVTHVCVNYPTGFTTIHKDITERLQENCTPYRRPGENCIGTSVAHFYD